MEIVEIDARMMSVHVHEKLATGKRRLIVGS